MLLRATNGDPLAAQEVDAALGELPDDDLALLLYAANGDARRAVEIAQRITPRWWGRLVEWARAHSDSLPAE